MLRIIVSLAFIGHGLGHLTGFLTAWTRLPAGFTDAPWILPGDVRMQSLIGRVFGLLWLAAMAVLVAAGVGVLARQPWWPQVAIAGAALSLIVIVPWWNTVVAGARYGGTAFNLLVLIALLPPWSDKVVQALK